MKHLYYGWITVLFAAIILAAHALTFYSFGIFLKPIVAEFNWDRGALSAALAICLLVVGPLGILTGRLSDKYGPRLLVTANGVLTGIGFFLLSQISSLWQVYLIWGLILSVAGSGCVVPITSTIPRWFAQKRGLAMGLTWTGIGLGGMIAPLLSQWLIDSYGWRQAYFILGLINFIIVTLLAQFIKHSPERIGLKPYGENESVEDEQSISSIAEGFTFKQAIKTGRFWLFGSILFCFFFTIQVIMVHIAPHIADIGISTTIAASIVSIFAATSLIGRNLSGFISDKVGTRFALKAFLVMVTLILIWLVFSREAWMFYLFAVLYGIAYGGMVPLQTLLTGELFGLKFLGMIVAALMLFGTIGGAVGAPLAGYIFDITGNYSLAFIICVILCMLATVLSLILSHSKDKKSIIMTK
ncbi:MFS transporter [Chloroflexota bacterium]